MFHQKPLLGKLPLWTPNPAGIPAPVGAWVMNEGSGGKICDLSLNGNHGTNNGADWCVDGLDFNPGDNIDIPNQDLTANWTIVFESYCNGGISPNGAMVLGNRNNITDFIYTGNNVRTRFSNSAGEQLNWMADTNFYHRWRQCVFVADTTGIELYLDSITQGRLVITPSLKFYHIGAGYTTEAYNYDGIIKYMYLFNTALSTQQVVWLYQHPYYAWEYPEIWELYAAAAGGIDETGKLISIVSTLSGADKQAYKDLQKLIAITSAIQGADVQAYKEFNKQIPITATITGSDLQAYIDTEKLIEIISAIQGADIQAYKELSKQILVTSTISAADIQGFIESLLVGITATISEADLLSYNERNRTIPITAAISVSDLQAYKDIVNILIASAVSKTDLQNYKDIADIGVTSTLEGTDKQAYKDTGEIPISSAFTASDFQFYVDQGIISITCTLSETDSISILAPAEVRMTFKLVPRITDFTLAQRNKDFKLVERTKDFEILN